MTPLSPSQQILLLHIVYLPLMVLIFYIRRPGGIEKSFTLNKKMCGFLLPGKWKNRDYFVLWTERLSLFWLILLSGLYLMGWFFISRG